MHDSRQPADDQVHVPGPCSDRTLPERDDALLVDGEDRPIGDSVSTIT